MSHTMGNRSATDTGLFLQERENVLTACRTLADRGFLAGTGGNVALRVDDEHFCVTPSATDYYRMTATDICVLKLSDQSVVSGLLKPSVECGLHARVLQARADCMASVHTHQPIASAYTLLAQPLINQSDPFQSLLGQTVPCAGYAPSGTLWLARRVAQEVRPDVHAYLMRNHGVVCVGTTMDEAIERVVALEQACDAWFEEQS